MNIILTSAMAVDSFIPVAEQVSLVHEVCAKQNDTLPLPDDEPSLSGAFLRP